MNMPGLSCLVVTGALLVVQPVAPIQPSRNTFIGTTPCGEVVRAFVGGMAAAEKCHAIKWELTLGGAAGFPDASVYQLDADASHGPILLLRVNDNLVLFLDQHRQPLPGTADFSYTRSRSDQS